MGSYVVALECALCKSASSCCLNPSLSAICAAIQMKMQMQRPGGRAKSGLGGQRVGSKRQR